MKESLLHYVWQQKLFANHDLRTTEGEDVIVIDTIQMRVPISSMLKSE